MEDEYWYKLIEDRVLVQKKTGYTLPFLIGAQEIVNIENPIGIKELLEEMKDYHKKVTIRYCLHTREYVATIGNKFNYSESNGLNFNSLTIVPTHSFLEKIEDFEDIIDACENIYLQPISDKTFSKIVSGHENYWGEFQEDEKEDIKRILQ